MREITHRIKIYTSTSKPPFHLLANSTVFRLLVTQLIVSTLALGVYYTDRFWWDGTTYRYVPYWVLLGETVFILAGLQLHMLRQFAKDRGQFPTAPTCSLRIAYRRSQRLKFQALITAFSAPYDPEILAEELREQWRNRSEIQKEILIAKGFQTRKLFRLPSSSTFAGYLIGAVGMAATLIVAYLQREELVESLPISWAYFKAFMVISVVPLVALVILVPAVWNGLRASGLSLREKLDDDYLSDKSFYSFIEELLDLHDTRTPRLLLKTSGRVYWSIRILTAPISRLSFVIRQARKSGRIGKLRRMKHHSLFNPFNTDLA